MPEETYDTQIDVETDPKSDTAMARPELDFDPGEIAPCWASPYPDAELEDDEQKALKRLADMIGETDITARRFEVEQAWQMRLFDRGYQYLLPRRGGGWIYVPFQTSYQYGRSGQAFFGNETNIIATYGEIISAALTRDVPRLRFEPQNPSSDADITAKDAATDYARIFSRTNDLQDLQQQLAYYLRVDGRALIVTDHIIDAQQFGRCEAEPEQPLVPETEGDGPKPYIYAVSEGITAPDGEEDSEGIDQKGERQIEHAADWLKDKGIQAVYSAPSDSAMASAQIIAEKLGVQVEVDDRLASIELPDKGMDGERVSHEEIERLVAENPEFQQTVQSAVMDLLSAEGKPVAIVVDDAVISQIFKMFQGDDVPPTAVVDPGWIATVTPDNDGMTFKPQVAYPFNPPESATGQKRGKPRGQEVAKVYGKLEHRVPFAASSGLLSDCQWVQVAGEYDETLPKAMFPEKADKIKASGASPGENQIDRTARINSTLALEAGYLTGDSMIRDCTVTRTWFRPSFFMAIENKRVREAIFQKFPDGALVIQAGEEFIKARNENMDDHLTLVHATQGSGMNRQALCSKILSVNKRLNTWLDLLDQYFVKCVPMRYMAQGPFDVTAINDQGTVVGGYTPFLLDNVPQNRSVTDLIWQEPYPTPNPVMSDFIKFFITELPQLLSHALPSLFGSGSNTDTATGIAIQRDQALGCLGSPWHSINVATANYFRQAVQLAAQCRPAYGDSSIQGMVDGKVVTVDLTQLKGNVMAYPDSDANFPESWVQRQSRWTQMIQEANNPLFQKLMESIKNRMAALDAIGLEGLSDPDKPSWEKQQGEFEILLKTPPVPNPEYQQAQQAIQEAAQQIQGEQAAGSAATPEQLQAIQQMEQSLQSIAPMVSSYPVKDSDDHAVEAECCLEKIRSADGRKMADGDPEQRASFQNLVLHWTEHDSKIPRPPDAIKDLPKGFSAAIDKLPPDAAANLLTSVGAETKGPEVVQNREFTAELRKSSRVTGPPVPGMGT